MKKHFKFLMLALLALMPLTLISCGDDDDDNNSSSSKTIQINGKSYELNPYVVQEGSFDAEDGEGKFAVGVFKQSGNSEDCWYYEFSYTDSEEPKVGDDFSKNHWN